MAASGTETDRLVLVSWDAEHTELLVGLSSMPEVMTFIGSGDVWSRTKAEEVARAAREHWAEHGFGWRAATERTSGEFIGFVALNFAGDGTAGVAADEYEIGWWMDPAVWGQGFAREGGAAIRDEALGRLNAPSVIARIQPSNARSIAVAQSLGLTHDCLTTGNSGELVCVYRLTATPDRPD
jgi:RimJ/RimL family protein N-acetyltransferase